MLLCICRPCCVPPPRRWMRAAGCLLCSPGSQWSPSPPPSLCSCQSFSIGIFFYNLLHIEKMERISGTVFWYFICRSRYGGYKNPAGIGLSYRAASQCSLATQFQTRFLESIPRPIAGLKSFRLGFVYVGKFRWYCIVSYPLIFKFSAHQWAVTFTSRYYNWGYHHIEDIDSNWKEQELLCCPNLNMQIKLRSTPCKTSNFEH